MPGRIIFDEETFRKIYQDRLGEHWGRVLAVFRSYGKKITFDVAYTVIHAVEKEKVREVLAILEEHWRDYLRFQRPEIRKTVSNLGVNPTRQMFLRIYHDTLGLEPRTSQKEAKP